jgi:putative endonuclease
LDYFVYILKNPAGKFYIGSTNDLERRLREHNLQEQDKHKFTHKNGPWLLVYSERFNNRSDAMVRELYIKKMKSARWIRENLLADSSINKVSPDKSGLTARS